MGLGGLMMEVKKVEININIQETPKEYIDNLILGLVHSGYEAYFNFEKDMLCFTGCSDDLIKEIKDN